MPNKRYSYTLSVYPFPSFLRRKFSSKWRALTLFILCCAYFSVISVRAQMNTSHSVTDGYTPSGIAGGSPSGSYVLSGFDTINMYSGQLNFALPMLTIGGRGEAAYQMTLQIDRSWTVKTEKNYTGPGTPSSAFVVDRPYFNDWNGLVPGYGPGVLQGRRWRDRDPDPGICIGCSGSQCTTVTRLSFIQADGTEFEMRDVNTDGFPNLNFYSAPGFARGSVFATKDGTSATFVSDAVITDVACNDTSFMAMHGPNLVSPSGYLKLRNGLVYRIDSGLVTWIRDRHGNQINFQNWGTNGAVTQITDQLGRTISIEYLYCGGSQNCDTITYKGFGGADRTIKVWYSAMDQARRADYSGKSEAQLFPLNGSNPNGIFNPRVISSLELPDGRRYFFKYNDYAELARVELPTGGAYEYDWAGGRTDMNSPGLYGGNGNYRVYRGVKERRVYADGTNLTNKTTYTPFAHGTFDERVAEVSYDGAGAEVAHTDHYFFYNPIESLFDTAVYPHWAWGREYRTDSFNAAGTLLVRKDTTWALRAPVSWVTNGGNMPINDPRITQVVTTLADVNKVSKWTSINPANGVVGYDQFNNQTDLWEYDYGNGAPSTHPVRHTHTDYLTTNPVNGIDYSSHTTAHLRGLVKARQVYAVNSTNGSETLLAQSSTAYDEPAYGLLTYGTVVGWSSTGTAARGNATSLSNWLNTTGGWLATHSQYDQVGNVRNSWDANNNLTQLTFNDSFSDGNNSRNTYAFLTNTTSPTPDPGNTGFGSFTPLTSSSIYDYSTGFATSATDGNGKTTIYNYADPLNRLKVVTRPDGGQTLYNYDRYTNAGVMSDYIKIQTSIDASRLMESYHFSDGLGRPNRTFLYEGGSPGVFRTTDTQYDALGRVWRVSNAHRTAGSDTPINPPGLWTTTVYDALSRVKTVTNPDGAKVYTMYDGPRTMVSDAAGRQRISQTDALGRLAEVWEVRSPDAATGTESVSFPIPSEFASVVPAVSAGYRTSYNFDALGNLRKVTQGAQQRFFMYDSLSRLTRAKNPEQSANGALAVTDPLTGNSQWSSAYGYDSNGNPTTRIDARNVQVTYGYDPLNRNTTTSYTNDPAGTLAIVRKYDQATNGRGRPYFVGQSGSSTSATYIDAYDVMGHVSTQRQKFETNGVWGADYTVSRTYNRAGNVVTQSYPSGRSVTYSYDIANRLADDGAQPAFKGTLGDATERTYASQVVYDVLGGMSQERYATTTPVYNKHFYNVRGQLTEVRVSTLPLTSGDPTNWNRGALINHFSDLSWAGSGADNNGNLKKQDVYIPNDDAITGFSLTTFFYEYEGLNRLSRVREVRNGADVWAQKYDYDRYGNRTINQLATWSAPQQQFTVDQNANRLGVPAGQCGQMVYDAAGNLTFDTYQGGQCGGGTRTYDGENRMTSSQYFSGQTLTAVYAYDAEGRRVRRNVGTAAEVWQVYGIEGELLAEYAPNGSPTQPQKEYGYRNGELLLTAAPGGGGGSTTTQGATWTNAWNVSVSGGQLTKSGSNGWNGGAVSTQSISSAGGYVEVKAGDAEGQMIGLGSGDSNQSYTDIDYAVWIESGGVELYVYENGVFKADIGMYWPNDTIRVAVEGGVVKYRVNGALAYTSSVSPSYPLTVDTSLYATSTFIRNVIVGTTSSGSSGATLQWLISDQLGTPRMILGQSGTLSSMTRHDYLPFGEEALAGTGGRTTAQGYSVADNLRQKFTKKERDVETGLDYFIARYYHSLQGRFTGVDPYNVVMHRQGGRGDEKTENVFLEFLGNPQRWNRYAYAINAPTVFTDPTGLDIMIIENHSTGITSNPFGHTAIAITGRGVFSMGNGADEPQTDKRNNIMGGSVREYIKREIPRRNTTIIIIKTTPAQDAAAAAKLKEVAGRDTLEKGSITSDNCSVRVNEALDAAGIKPGGNPSMPGSAGERAKADGGLTGSATVIEIPFNSDLLLTDRTVLGPFEPRKPRAYIPPLYAPGGTPVETMTAPTRTEPQRRRRN